ncbi:ANKS1B [Bugula neritina]|uniref:ANKS1B n=1 Tax=Bugula neritina TaxID=10212 RepID=A0A7J7J431_BUGNE|nr:ANKS1B [Bugula neritina]
MGKEHNLLEAARSGNTEYIKHYISKLKHSTHHKSSKKSKSVRSTHSHSSRISSSVLSPRGIALNCRDQNGESLLHLATVNNHKTVVTLLINGGAHVNALDNQGCLPLHFAAWTGNAEICRALLVPLTINDVNRQNKAGDTSLHIASQYGHVAVVKLLLQHDANPMIRNVRGESSLDLACFYGRLETVSLLIREQPALVHQFQLSHSPLHLAARNGQKDVVKKLLQCNYNINTKTKCGSALHEAATYGKVSVMKLLLQSGIDKSIKDKNNQTVEELLKSQCNSAANNLLLILSGRENPYHSLNPEAGNPPKQSLCKHGKPLASSSTHHRRIRERSSSGQVSDGSSSSTTPPMTRSTNINGGEYKSCGKTTACHHHTVACYHQRRGHQSSSSNLQGVCSGHQGTHYPAPSVPPTLPNSAPSQSNGNHKSQCRRCKCQHSKQSNENNIESSKQGLQVKDVQFARHKSCSEVVQSSYRTSSESSSAFSVKNAINTASFDTGRTRHKSCAAQLVSTDGDYIRLSDTISCSLPDKATDHHLYNSICMELVSTDHVYNKMDRLSSSSLEEESLYDKVPKPCPIPIADQWNLVEGPPLSPSVFSNQSSTNGLYESKDSVYESHGSLSPEPDAMSSRGYLGHIYVNLTNYRSTPDLNRIHGEAPKKPPRTPDTHLIQNECIKSKDYACLHISSKSHENIASNIISPVQSERSSNRLVFSVPPNKSEGHFIFPATSSSSSHDYENMTAIMDQLKTKHPPKVKV